MYTATAAPIAAVATAILNMILVVEALLTNNII